ncbi:MAG: hypothetical protein JNJ57_17255 [Saprospiraceae bacterium]|nr:hypothetical protein [Saprospiraceae bacterium]
MLTKAQIGAIIGATVLFSVLYFGFDRRPADNHTINQSRSIQGESISIETLIEEAKKRLSEQQISEMETLEGQLKSEQQDASRIESLKKISGFWYRANELPQAGFFAEEIANLENSDSSWSVAGALFYTGLVQSQDQNVREYCAKHAVKAFESAASLAPEIVEHRVNLALTYAENPPPDNPMQAVLMLRDLEQKYPESSSVYNALGRLAIKTGQWQRAVDRLEKSWSLEKNNPNTPCLLAKAYEGLGNQEKSTEFAALCKGR